MVDGCCVVTLASHVSLPLSLNPAVVDFYPLLSGSQVKLYGRYGNYGYSDAWSLLDRRQVIIELSKIKNQYIRNVLDQKTAPDEIQESLDMDYFIHSYEENYDEEVNEITRQFHDTDINPLIDALKHDNWEINCKAARALGNLGHKSAVPALIQTLQDYERNPAWDEVAIALGKIGNRLAIRALIQALKHEDYMLHSSALSGLREVKRKLSKKDISAIVNVLSSDEEPILRITAADILGKIGGKAAIQAFLSCILFDENSAVRERAALEFGKLAQPPSIAFLWDSAATTGEFDLLKVISTVQNRCQFYNYKIATQFDPPPAVRQDLGVGNQGQTINHFNIENLNANHSALNLGGTIQGDQTVNQYHNPEP